MSLGEPTLRDIDLRVRALVQNIADIKMIIYRDVEGAAKADKAWRDVMKALQMYLTFETHELDSKPPPSMKIPRHKRT